MKKKQMVILVALLAVLAAAYGLLSFSNKKAQEEEESKTVQVTDLGEIKAFSYAAPEQEELHFKKNSSGWVCTNDKSVSLNQTYPDNIADTFSSLTATRKLEDIDSLEDYGLEDPAYTVTLTPENGEKTVVKIGNQTGEEYYLQVKGEEQVVYTVASSVAGTLDYSLEDMEAEDEETESEDEETEEETESEDEETEPEEEEAGPEE